jgi:hypothetical protein
VYKTEEKKGEGEGRKGEKRVGLENNKGGKEGGGTREEKRAKRGRREGKKEHETQTLTQTCGRLVGAHNTKTAPQTT